MAYDQAKALHDAGRFDEAAEAYRAVIDQEPAHVFSWRGLALLAGQQGDPDKALALFRKAAELDPQNTLMLHDLAMGLRQAGQAEQAEQAYRAVVAMDATHAFSWRGLALLAHERGAAEEALDHFRKAAEHAPQNTLMLHDLAMGLREAGRAEEAEQAYLAVVALDDTHVFSWRGLALLARERGAALEALEHFRKAAALDPQNTLMLHDLAMGLREAGQAEQAEQAYRAVVAKDPSHVFSWRGLGLLARERGDADQALDYFRKAVALDPQNTLMLHDLAMGLREAGQAEQAEEAYRAVVTKDPAHGFSWRGLALLARERGDHDQALDYFRKAAALGPQQIWTFQDIATELRLLGRRDEAEAALKTLVDQHPQSADALIAYAHSIRHKIDASQFTSMLESAAALEPRHLQAKLGLAQAYLASWRLNDAEALFDAALDDDAHRYAALLGKGQIGRRRGEKDQARKLFAEAAATPGAPFWAAFEWCNELAGAGCFDEARDILGKAISRAPQEPALHLQLGYVERAAGDYAAARAAFSHAVAQNAAAANSGGPQAEIELAAEDVRLGQADQALSRLAALLGREPRSGPAWNALANMLQQIGDEPGAAACRARAVELEPSDLGSQLQLARSFERLGRPREAEDVFETCDKQFGPLPETAVIRAELFKQRGDYPAAHLVLQQAAANFPTHFDLWFNYVASLIHFGVFDEARRATDAPPACSRAEQVRALMLRGEIARAEWRFDEAYACMAEAARFYTADPGIHHKASIVALLSIELEATQFHLEASTRHDPGHRFRHGGGWKASQTHIGQLLDEYRLEATALARLREGLQSDDPVEAFARLVGDFPDYTPAAIHFLIGLRRKGWLDRPDAPPIAERRIPTSIIQFWDADLPADVEALCDGWRRQHPDYHYQLFSKVEARSFLADMDRPEALAAFDRASEPAMKADIFRLAVLYQQGGYYVDADDRCLAPISTIDSGQHSLILYQEDLGTVANNFIGVVARHPMIGQALNAACEAINRGDTDMIWLATGPGLLTRSLAAYLAVDVFERSKTIRILQRHELFKAVAIHCVTAYKYTSKHWSRTSFKQTRMRSRAVIESLLSAVADEHI